MRSYLPNVVLRVRPFADAHRAGQSHPAGSPRPLDAASNPAGRQTSSALADSAKGAQAQAWTPRHRLPIRRVWPVRAVAQIGPDAPRADRYPRPNGGHPITLTREASAMVTRRPGCRGGACPAHNGPPPPAGVAFRPVPIPTERANASDARWPPRPLSGASRHTSSDPGAASLRPGYQRATHDMVAHTWQVLHTTAADQHDRVLLQVVAFARDIGRDFMLDWSGGRAQSCAAPSSASSASSFAPACRRRASAARHLHAQRAVLQRVERELKRGRFALARLLGSALCAPTDELSATKTPHLYRSGAPRACACAHRASRRASQVLDGAHARGFWLSRTIINHITTPAHSQA